MKENVQTLAQLFACIVASWIGKKRYKGGDDAVERVDPKYLTCGLAGVRVIIQCDCGNLLTGSCSPSGDPEAMREYAAKHPDIAKVVANHTAEEAAGEAVEVAANGGHTLFECEQCSRRILANWNIEACSVKQDVVFPWEDSEVPDPSASEPSFSIPRKAMVH